MSSLMIPIISSLVLMGLGIMFISGRGLFLIAGYSSLSKLEKENLDRNLLGVVTGIILISIGMVVATTEVLTVVFPDMNLIIKISALLFIVLFCLAFAWVTRSNQKFQKADKK